MLRELRCENYKAFGDETRFPLSSLTVLVGPNNAGKSTALDLVRLTKNGHSLDLTSGRGRLRNFDSLLGNRSSKFLKVGRRVSREVILRPGGRDAPDFHLADDLSFESVFKSFGNGFMLKKRDVFLHPRGEAGPSRQRIISERVDVGPMKETSTTPSRPAGEVIDDLSDEESEDDQEKESEAPTPDKLWFGLPLDDQSHGIRRESPERGAREPDVMLDPPGPYERQVSTTQTVDESVVALILSIINTYRRHSSEKAPVDLSAEPLEFPQNQSVSVQSKKEPPSAIRFPLHALLEDIVGGHVPGWVPLEKHEEWKSVQSQVLVPLLEKIRKGFNGVDSAHLSSFRARPERYYGPQDPLTPLLEEYQDAHPTAQDDVEEWLDVFELGSDLDVESVAPDLYAASVRRNGGRRYLADLGSGTAQLLPLILKLTVGSPSSVLLLEEPEANLHPNLQSRLADLLVELIGSGHQVLVETHSEYLVRRLQYLVAKGQCDPDSASVLYVDATDSTDTSTPDVRSISIDEHGQLSEPFGGGFFDEATDLMVDLFKYGSEN